MRIRPRRDVGHEPDYRLSFANERTFLAYIRTALALDGGGLAVVQLLPDLNPPWARQGLGAALVLMGLVLAGVSLRRWARNEEALRTDAPLPESRAPLYLAIGVMALSVVAVVILMATTA